MDGEKNSMANMMTRWFKGYRGKRSIGFRYIREILREHDMMGSSSDTGLERPELHMIKFSQDKNSIIKPSAAVTEGGVIKIDGRIWIPKKDLGLLFAILIYAHCGIGGHRGSRATASSLKESFIWKGIDEDFHEFVKACVHFVVSTESHAVYQLHCTHLYPRRLSILTFRTWVRAPIKLNTCW